METCLDFRFILIADAETFEYEGNNRPRSSIKIQNNSILRLKIMNFIVFTLLITAATLTTILLAVHIGFRAPRRKEKGSPADFGLAYSEISIRTLEGKRLYAWWLPMSSISPTIILLYGWGGNAELMLPLAVPFRNAGLNVLLLDARNHGRSDSASFSSLPRFAEDVSSAINWVKMQDEGQRDTISLLGHSVIFGRLAASATARASLRSVLCPCLKGTIACAGMILI